VVVVQVQAHPALVVAAWVARVGVRTAATDQPTGAAVVVVQVLLAGVLAVLAVQVLSLFE
jgi:hypothetical protein